MAAGDDPFRAYHRAEWWTRACHRGALAAVCVAVVTALSLTVAGAPAAPTVAIAASEPEVAVAVATAPDLPAESPAETPNALPAPAADASAEAAQPVLSPPTLADTGTRQWSIEVDTTGHQAEIDACLWVRMELGISAPLVGAHNYCGGGVVLEIGEGDVVTLRGTGLDGTYTVTGARDARAGDRASTATDGLDADVILQTCYWSNDGRVRLVALALG